MVRGLLALATGLILALGLAVGVMIEGATAEARTVAGAPTTADRCTGATEKAAIKQVRKAYTTLLNGNPKVKAKQKADIIRGTDTDRALRSFLLDTYAKYASILKNVKAKVRTVTCRGPADANVNFNVLLGPLPILRNQTGTAILEGGRWKIDKSVVCDLVASVEPSLTSSGPCTT